ncbi:MAG: proprotein convertase P-domain-containing protein, partial [Bacteroidota bacterium]
NICGPGEWAESSFTTEDLTCGRFAAPDLPAEITSDGTPEVRLEVEVTNAFSVEDLEISLAINHSFIGDVEARLRSPAGTEIQLFNRSRNGSCDEDNMSVVFTDAATNTANNFRNTCAVAPVAIVGTFQPADPFSSFLNENAEGTWTLILNDRADNDGGEITSFNLLFCNQGALADLSVSASVRSLETCLEEASTVVLTLGADFSGQIGLEVETATEVLANYTSVYDPDAGTITVDFSNWAGQATGDYTLTFTLTNGDGTERMFSLPLRLSDDVDMVTLSGPEDGANLQEGEVMFTWDVASDATGYTWQYSTAADFSTIDGEQTGNDNEISVANLPTGDIIYWRVIAQSACGTTTSAVREFRIVPAGTHDFGANRILNVYPNPVKGQLTVEATGSWPQGVKATLFDATGRRMADYRMANAGQDAWDLGAIPAGVYYLRFTSLGTERTERLVVLP